MDYSVKTILNSIKNPKVSVSVPGSKSITVRAMLIAALAHGESVLTGIQLSEDCRTFLGCLKNLGIQYELKGTTLKVRGGGGRVLKRAAQLNVGSAGTAARFMPALLAFQKGKYKLDCSAQMRNRPIEPLIKTLEETGVRFSFLGEKHYAYPFVLEGSYYPPDEITVNIDKSSQFLSALLISAVCADKPIKINVEGSHGMKYVDMTLDMMWSFGVDVKREGNSFTVDGSYTAKRYDIEPDVSAACYFYAINKILPTQISVNGVSPHSMQGDAAFVKLLENFDGGVIDMHEFSDQALTLAAIAPYLKNPTEITGVEHIRGQECDRIKAIVHNLTAMGVKCEERADGVKIYPSVPHGAEIETFDDHRVAMSFALCGLVTEGIVIKNAEACHKTFREYFDVLDKLVLKLTKKNGKNNNPFRS